MPTSGYTAHNPDVMPYDTAEPPEDPKNKMARMEAFLQKFLIGRVKGTLPPAEMKKVEEVAEEMKKEITRLNEEVNKKQLSGTTITGKMGLLVQETISKLGIEPDNPQNPQRQKGTELGMGGQGGEKQQGQNNKDPDNPTPSDYDTTFSSKEAQSKQGKAGKEKVEKDMGEYFDKAEKETKAPKRVDGKTKPDEITKEDVETANTGTTSVTDEYAKISRGEKVDPSLFGWQGVPTQVPAEAFRDKNFINKMKVALKHWKTGRVEIIGERGQRLSIPQYIHSKDTPFATRIKKSARGKKLLILADFSGSQKTREDAYKKALISGIEVLSGIGSNVALFGFGTDPAYGNKFFRIKQFEDPKWLPSHSNKLAAMEADFPNTPTASAYRQVEAYVKKTRPYAMLTVTDGFPDSSERAEVPALVRRLRKSTRMVAFGIAPDARYKDSMEQAFKDYGYTQHFTVTNVQDIPDRLVKIIAPSS